MPRLRRQVRLPEPNSRCAIRIAAVAFRQSRISVSAASGLLPVLRTLVAPMLPEPMLRMSPLPESRVSTKSERDRPQQIAEHHGEEHLAGHSVR